MSRSVFLTGLKVVWRNACGLFKQPADQEAKELLANHKYNISEIALQQGYQSQAAFNRMFKAKVGSTPAAFGESKTV